MTDQQLVAIASASVLSLQHFPCTTEDWERLPDASKTWAAWKTAFLQAHMECKQLLWATGGEDPYQGQAHASTDANAARYKKLYQLLDNLANAATATTTNAATTNAGTNDHSSITQLMEAHKLLVAAVAALTVKVNAGSTTTPTTPGKTTKSRTTAVETANRLLVFDPMGYCWSHGYMFKPGHFSATCPNKNDGHKYDATRADTKGGVTWTKGWESFK